jgi:hypothetical protein
MQARKSNDGDVNAVYRIVLPAEQAAVLHAALQAIRAELDSHGGAAAGASAEASCPQEQAVAGTDADGGASAEARSAQPAPMTEPATATLADAFLAMSRAALDQQAGRSPSAARRTRAARSRRSTRSGADQLDVATCCGGETRQVARV